MDLQQRLDLLKKLGNYLLSNDEKLDQTIEKAHRENGWFTPEFIHLAINNITTQFLEKEKLLHWIEKYDLPKVTGKPKNVGVVMAGNIPLVGFHDFLCVFVSGHIQTVKPSSKDEVLIRHFVDKLTEWNSSVANYVRFGDMLKGCDAYIATGSNNSSRYFKYYFSKYPNIIRRNRTSVAIITGQENVKDLAKLADDVHQYFGLGCRNVTKIYVPHSYDFVPILDAFRKYGHLADHNKFRNNYDYQLALLIMNRQYYMTNGSIILTEQNAEFAAISRLHYDYYEDKEALSQQLAVNQNIQCIVSSDRVPFGTTQLPGLTDYADKIDSMLFLRRL